MDRWVGKVAVVTGASSGIGAAVTRSLLKAGVLVVGLARRFDRLHAQSAIEGSEWKLYPMRCDLTKEEELLDAFKWVNTELGGVDILVNNAGVAGYTKIIDDTAASFRKILDVNVLATALCLREAVASMRSRDVPGHIININSIFGHVVPPPKFTSSLYPPSKYAVTALTEVVRKELTTDPDNKIKITSLSPGLVKTEIHASSGVPEELYTAVFNRVPYLDPDDIADAVLYVLGTRDNVQIFFGSPLSYVRPNKNNPSKETPSWQSLCKWHDSFNLMVKHTSTASP